MPRRHTAPYCVVLIAALVFFGIAPAAAQDTTGAACPTTADIETVTIPPRDQVALAEELRGVTDIPPTPASAVTRQVGERQVFTANDLDNNVTIDVPTTLRVVGKHIYLWVEDGADVSDSDLQALADAFDTSIYDGVRDLWGSEANPGVDGDPRVYGVFAHNLGDLVAAYFASDHTYPREVVPYSNEHEMFFFNLDGLSNPMPLEDMESTVAHEFQHMIRANLQGNSETWLDEGMSVFTEYYLYDLGWAAPNFLNEPNTQLNDWNEETGSTAAHYGAAQMFMIYLYERYGLDALRALSADHSSRALHAVDDVLLARGEPGVDDFFADWVLANYLSDEDYKGGRFGYPDLNGMRTPPLLDTVTGYPYEEADSANQYATNYYILTNLNGIESLDIHLDAPGTVALVPTTGTHFWYSNRGDKVDSRLTRTVDLTNVADATLKYRLWYDNEESWDYGYVMVSLDGEHWIPLSTPYTTTDDPNGLAYGAGYTGASDGWIDESIPLSDYAGKKIFLRFELITDDATNRYGMALDDVSIPEIGFADDFEGGCGDWQAEGWLLTDNLEPQQVWVQAAQQVGGQTADVERWRLDGAGDQTIKLVDGVDQVVLAVSPFASVTSIAMPYTLDVTANP